MSLDRILSIVAALLGVSGSILLAKGTLKLTPDVIAKQSQAYWGYNKSQLENITSQKADFICGIPLILIAFLVQIINLIFVYDSLKIYPFRWAILLIICFAFPVLIITFLINKFLVKKYRIDSQRALAKEWLLQDLEKHKISHGSWESLLKNAVHLYNMKKIDNESPVDFLKRYSAFFGSENSYQY